MKKEIAVFVTMILFLICSFTGCIENTQEDLVSIETSFISPILPYDKIIFNANTSVDVEEKIGSYHWDFDDGNEKHSKTAVHNYNSPGDYNVKLSVFDSDNKLICEKEQTVNVVSTPHFSLTINQINKNYTTGITDFNITIIATDGHKVKLEDVSVNAYFYVDDEKVVGLSSSVESNEYYDVDGDGFVSTGDYVNYTYNPIFIEPYSDNATSFVFALEYETHASFNVNRKVTLGTLLIDKLD